VNATKPRDTEMNGTIDPARRPAALIFRKRLLPWSETFIAAQGRALVRYRPVFVGYRDIQAGKSYLAGEDRVLLEEHALLPFLARGAFKAFGRVPRRWLRALESRSPTLIHAHFGNNAAAALPLARALGIPLLATFHGMDIAIERKGAQRQQLERVFREAARVIAVSEFIAGRLRTAGCPGEKITVHHIGVDTGRFAPGDPGARAAARILFVGRLVPKKGLIHLLRAMASVQRAVPEATLVIAGDGPLRPELERAAAEHGAHCEFLGVQSPDRVRELMRTATVLAAPSVVAADGNAEGLPITIMEAQASGLPVVAFPSGGSAEGFIDGETGLLAPAGDEAALAAHLTGLLGDAARRARFSAAARAFALQQFDLARQTAKLEEIYDEVAGRR